MQQAIKFYSKSLPTPASPIFEITLDNGAKLYYSVYDNALYADPQKQQLISAEPVRTELDFQMVGTRKKRLDPYWLRIQLGQECNYSCSYCLQKDIGELSKPTKFKPTFDANSYSNLNTTNLSRIDLWGGEPLLYFDTMKQIMSHFDRFDGLEFFISTNGSILKEHHLQYFASLASRVCLGISHDGPKQEELRGKEFIYTSKSLPLLSKYGINWSFNPTISTQNPNISEVHDFFVDWSKRTGIKVPYINFGLQHDHSPISDGSSLSDHLKEFLARTDYIPNSLHDGDTGILGFAKSLSTPNVAARITSCGVDDSQVLSVDLKGNLLVCPHTKTKYGTLDSPAPITHVALNRYKEHCSSCHVWRLCKSTCPIETDQFEANCASSYDWYTTIFDITILKLTGHKVTCVNRYIQNN